MSLYIDSGKAPLRAAIGVPERRLLTLHKSSTDNAL